MTDRLAHVHRLATELAAKLRYAQIVDRPLPPEHVAALVDAARLLQDYGEPWPLLVAEVLQQVVDDLEEQEKPPEPEPAAEEAQTGLNRFLGVFRRDRTTPAEA